LLFAASLKFSGQLAIATADSSPLRIHAPWVKPIAKKLVVKYSETDKDVIKARHAIFRD